MRLHQRPDLRFDERRIKPAFLLLRGDDDWHPGIGVVDTAHQLVGLGRYNRISLQDLPGFWIAPCVPYPRKGENRRLLHRDVIRDLFLLVSYSSCAASRKSPWPGRCSVAF